MLGRSKLFFSFTISFSLFLLVKMQPLHAQDKNNSVKLPPLSSDPIKWVDSIYNRLNMNERIAQLFMVAAYSGTDKYNETEIKKLIGTYKIGGLIFMQGTASKQALLTNAYQKQSETPLLIAMDAEWGLGMRLTGIQDLPKQMFLGATRNEDLINRTAHAIADQCSRLGVHINFAPVADVNNNPKNPVINARSFGENKGLVSLMAKAYMHGLQDNGIMACAKHFPGHGDTDVDSHLDLPKINKSKLQLDSLEFYPFKDLIEQGIQSVMVAHLNIPSLETNKNVPSTLSSSIVKQLLKQELKFQGLVFTDALNMKGVTKYYQPGEVDYLAFKAGNDVLLFSENVGEGISRIKKAIDANEIPEKQLEESVKKILLAKFNAGLSQFKNIDTANIDNDINLLTTTLRLQTAEDGITLLTDPYNVMDKVRKKEENKIAFVFIGDHIPQEYKAEVEKNNIGEIFYAEYTNARNLQNLQARLSKYDAVVASIHGMSRYPKNNYGIDHNKREILKVLSKNKNLFQMIFGNPYSIDSLPEESGYMVCYDDNLETFGVALQILSQEIQAKGILPVSINNSYKYGAGIVSKTNSLGETVITLDPNSDAAKRWIKKNHPESVAKKPLLICCVNPRAVGSNEKYLDKIDALINNSITQGIMPGCRILVAKDGKVFYDKSFGYLDNTKKVAVTNNTLYDLASVTKTAATTLAVMKLFEQGKISLDGKLGDYLPQTKGTNKQYLKIKDILLHQAGLISWIPFYKETLDEYGYPKSNLYQKKYSAQFSVPVIEGLYMHKSYIDSMWQKILQSELKSIGRYVYSDLDFIFLQKVVEQVSGKNLDLYVYENFYKGLGLKYTCFNPVLNKIKLPIAPTEIDGYFRHKVVQGYVHDMGAAMFGGVAGHAGLFSTAEELGIIVQMLLNKGSYNGIQFLKPETVNLFTTRNSFVSRRAYGFDKPEPNKSKSQPTALNCSLETFGHTGFTGTCFWADPNYNIQFIFLSNRTYPNQSPNRLSSMNVREKVQEYIYQSLGISPR